MGKLLDKLGDANVPDEFVVHGERLVELANERKWKDVLAYYRGQEPEIQTYIQRTKKYSWCLRAARVGCL